MQRDMVINYTSKEKLINHSTEWRQKALSCFTLYKKENFAFITCSS